HQLGVRRRSVKKPKLILFDRLLWAWLCGAWVEWCSGLCIVKPETVIAWNRRAFRLFCAWDGRRRRSLQEDNGESQFVAALHRDDDIGARIRAKLLPARDRDGLEGEVEIPLDTH